MSLHEFTHQVTDLSSTLKTFSRRFTKDRDDALDLVQDTIFKAFSYRDKFAPDTNLKGWLFTIMRNTYINNYKKHHRVTILRGRATEPHFKSVSDPHTFSIPDSSFEYKELWKEIDDLKDEYSIPFKMHISGYKYQEIAGQLNLPIGTVKNRIHTARQEVQKQLAVN
jgi:RNA polymerase sigma factor (sigma-70 family)